jgi:hypothetical protein
MHACMHARARGPYSNTTFRSLAAAELAADFPFSHRSSDQDYLEIAPNDVDGLVTSRRYLVYNSWCRKWGDYLDLVPVSATGLALLERERTLTPAAHSGI